MKALVLVTILMLTSFSSHALRVQNRSSDGNVQVITLGQSDEDLSVIDSANEDIYSRVLRCSDESKTVIFRWSIHGECNGPKFLCRCPSSSKLADILHVDEYVGGLLNTIENTKKVNRINGEGREFACTYRVLATLFDDVKCSDINLPL